MQRPPLTPAEAVALVRRQVEQFEEAGMERDAAVLAAAVTLRIEPHKAAIVARPKEEA